MERSKDPSSVPNRGPELVAVNIAFMTAALIANFLRCYVRMTMVKAFGVDDWLMAVATTAFITYASFSIAGVHYGTGRHHKDLSVTDIATARNCWWYCYLFYCISMILSKVSIGCLLLRIAFRKLHVWIIYAAMFISVVAGTVFFFVTMFQCKPISFFWNKRQPGQCINMDVIIGLAYLYSTFSIISDFTFAILPGFLVWNLQLKPRTKIALIPLLTMGCIASSAVVARTPYLKNFNSPDFLWSTLDIATWSTVEQGLAITAGSLATLRPLFHLAAHKLGISTRSGTRPSNYGMGSPSASQVLSSPRKSSHAHNAMDSFKLSSVVEAQSSDEPKQEQADTTVRSPTWYQPLPKIGGLNSHRMSVQKKNKVTGDNESEKSLKAESSKESMDQDGMQIMVKKSFFITDEQR
ncbi:hypothetical protein K505DRAFT_299077 [Melanomma pulvis-pyrius CBS 109.77]|uniref:Rhodopsin domain-containing protein n=1 Tax=Melanomma pulvis-pyrius CBS 109.77 TaxID=1314802 RepID=A0A6A6XLV6_9PLEO|nr:hypothetical protein K505DRAFT_299077 [Melanomma pulvis-pyrius CBS 109.77]